MKYILLCIISCALVFSAPAKSKKCHSKKTKSTVEVVKEIKPIVVEDFDKTIHPGDDFFEYVNAKWIKANPIPSDKISWGAFDELQEKSTDAVKKIIDDAVKAKAPTGSNQQLLGDFYKSAMDTIAIDKAGLMPLQYYFDLIKNSTTREGIAKLSGILQTRDITTPFGFYIDQDAKDNANYITYLVQHGLGLPDRDYYFRTDDNSEKIKSEYKAYVQKIFQLMGNAQPEKSMQTVWKIETILAEASMTRVESRDPQATYNKFSYADLQNTYKNIDWDVLFNTMQFPKIAAVIINQPHFLSVYDSLLTALPITDWQTYQQFHLVNSLGRYLSSDIVNARFNFYGRILSGQQKMEPRWKRISYTANNYLRDIIGQEYIKENFSPNAKERALELINNIKLSLKERINQLTWMSQETKAKALDKLEEIDVKIGYPDKWHSYDGLEIKNQAFVLNMLNAIEHENKRLINQLGKPIDRTSWYMGPQTVNAYYNPTLNEIVFPAAILQPPFFYEFADDAVNYGGIGMVIGHEITHGFDDQGSQFDAVGNLSNWWTDKDSEKYKELTKVFVDQYNSYKPIDNIPINGELTLGENIADFGGMILSLNALYKALENKKMMLIDGLTPTQRFFINYAIIWRDNIRPEALKQQIYTNEHSPAKYRVNGVLTNMPEFYDAFGVTSKNKLFLPKEKQTIMW